MVQLAEYFREPMALVEPQDLTRLNVLDWDDIHQRVQAILKEIDEYVNARVPQSRVTSGKTQSRSSFALFSYRTYQSPDETIDPIVVGLTFQPIPEGIRVTGDIVGESLGDVRLQSGPVEVIDEHGEVSRIASSTSIYLTKQAELVVLAIQDKNRKTIE